METSADFLTWPMSGKFKNMTPVSTIDIPQQTSTTSDATAFSLPSVDPDVQK